MSVIKTIYKINNKNIYTSIIYIRKISKNKEEGLISLSLFFLRLIFFSLNITTKDLLAKYRFKRSIFNVVESKKKKYGGRHVSIVDR